MRKIRKYFKFIFIFTLIISLSIPTHASSIVGNKIKKLALGKFIEYLVTNGVITGSVGKLLTGESLTDEEIRNNLASLGIVDPNSESLKINGVSDIDIDALLSNGISQTSVSEIQNLYDEYVNICDDESMSLEEKINQLSYQFSNNKTLLNKLVKYSVKVNHYYSRDYFSVGGNSVSRTLENAFNSTSSLATFGKFFNKNCSASSWMDVKEDRIASYNSFVSYCKQNNLNMYAVTTGNYDWVFRKGYGANVASVVANKLSVPVYDTDGYFCTTLAFVGSKGKPTVKKLDKESVIWENSWVVSAVEVSDVDVVCAFVGDLTSWTGSVNSFCIPYSIFTDEYTLESVTHNYAVQEFDVIADVNSTIPVAWDVKALATGLLDGVNDYPSDYEISDMVIDGILAGGISSDVVIGDIAIDKVIDYDMIVDIDDEGIIDAIKDLQKTLEDEDIEIDNSALIHNIDLTKKFPFCLPFDLKRMIVNLTAKRETPVFKVDLSEAFNGSPNQYAFEINMSKFDGLASILRYCILLAFVVGLIKLTKSIIS